MKKCKHNLHFYNLLTRKREYKAVVGYQFSVPKLKGVKLFIHKDDTGDLSGTPLWTVSEVSTGMVVSSGNKTLKEAKLSIEAKVRIHGVRTIRSEIKSNIEVYGIVPDVL